MTKLLCMETDTSLAKRIRAALKPSGYECILTASPEEALRIVQEEDRMFVILSSRLPWSRCFELLQILRKKSCPVLFLARSRTNEAHLRSVYQASCAVLTLPFTQRQLRQAVTELAAESDSTLICGGLRLNTSVRRVSLNGEALPLTDQEFELLKALMEANQQPLTREELLRTAWGYQSMGETRTVDVHVQRLRKKIGAGAIETVYRHGYRLALV